MSKLEELIQQYCPDGVEYHPLWSLTAWDKKFNGIDKSKQKRVIKYNYLLAADLKSYQVDEGTVKLLTTNISNLYTSEELAGDLASEGEVVAIPWGGNPIVQYYKGRFLTADNRIATSLDTNNLNNKFLYYCVLSQMKLISSFYRGSGIKHPEMAKVLDLEIPVPPLPVQEEIVRILDNFTELQAELQAELQKRKLQYNYYLDNLLNFNRGGYQAEVRWMKMSEVMSISRGASPRPIQNYLTDADDGIPWIKIGDVSPSLKYISSTKEKIKKEGATKSRYLKKGDFILSNSMSFGRPYILNIDGCIHDGWISMYGFEEHLDQDYLYYVLRSESVQTFWTAKANSGGAVSNLNSDIVRNTLIPIPSMTEQKKIVSILNRFDTLTNDLTQGLPAEIEKRRQQYEYYRDKLLTFKRKAA